MILTSTELAGKLAREYLRVSYDRTGKMESPTEQHDDNAIAATRLGLVLGDAYAEPNAVSAARWSQKVRGEFERLVADLTAGEFGAAVLILWESSRGGRSVADWVRLVDACEQAAVHIFVTTHQRLYDPKVGRDRRSLLEDALDAEYDNSRRRDGVLRSTAARAARGEAHGRIPYGFRRRYDPVTRGFIAQETDPGEAPNVEELFRRLHEGHALNAIMVDWRERGIMTRGSRKFPPRPFRHTDLLKMARNPAYVGLRVRRPKGTWPAAGNLDGAVPAKWPAIVDAEIFHSVQALLADPTRRTSRDGRARHLLGMIARCGACGGPLTVRYKRGARTYYCRAAGHVDVSADSLDKLATDQVKKFLARPDNRERLRPSPAHLEGLKTVRAELEKARGDLQEWRRKAGRREVSPDSFAVIEPPIIEDIARLEARERELMVPPELAGWTGPRAEVDARWENSPLTARRRITRVVLSDAYLGVMGVMPAPDHQRVPIAWRVRWGDGPVPDYAGQLLRDAERSGVSPEEYERRAGAGELFCMACSAFHAAGEFGLNGSLPGGRERVCLRSRREAWGRKRLPDA